MVTWRRCRGFKQLFRLLLFVVTLWIFHRGWKWLIYGYKLSIAADKASVLDDILRKTHRLCSISKEMGHGSSYAVCKESKFGTLGFQQDVVLVSLESQDLFFEKQLLNEYNSKVRVYIYGSGPLAMGPPKKISTLYRSRVVFVQPVFFRLARLPFVGRYIWVNCLHRLLQDSTKSSTADTVSYFKMGHLEGEPVSPPWLLIRLLETGALEHFQQLHLRISVGLAQDDALIEEWLSALTSLQNAQFALFRSKVMKRCGRRPCCYTTSWIKTLQSTVPPSVLKINPLDPNANFVDKLRVLLATPTASCSRRLSIPVTPVPLARQLTFPVLAVTHWPVCLEHLRPPCLVYSARIGGSSDFEDAMSRLGCEIFLFDPSLDEGEATRLQQPDSTFKVRSYNWGLANINKTIISGVQRVGGPKHSSGTWRYVRASEIVQELGHEKRTIDILRLDMQGGEWDILQNFMESGAITNFRQVVVSMHIWHGESIFSLIDRFVRTQKLIGFGFGIYHSEPMVDPGLEFEPQSCCHVVGWIRVPEGKT